MKDLIGRLLFPPRCAACRELLDWYEKGKGLCARCQAEWTAEMRELCTICTKEVANCSCMPELMQKAKCEGFRKLTYYYPKTRKKVQNRVIYTIKESCTRTAFDYLANGLKPMVDEIVGDRAPTDFCIAYLPRTRAARERYGVDQAEQLARALSKLTGIALIQALLRDGGKEQKQLVSNERLRNAQGSYRIKDGIDLSGKRVLLVDDLVTTGASMAVGVKLLRRAGAKSVYALAVASDITNREIL